MRVLVVCTGNSCRSVIAEALLNARGQGQIQAHSAGSTPAGFVHPGSLAALDRHDVPYGSPSSQSWDKYAGQSFDVVITVCDSAAAETCPVFHGLARRVHWSTPDPAAATGSQADIDAVFDSVFKQLDAQVRNFVTESVG